MDKAMNAYSLFTMVSDQDIPIFEQEFNAKGAKEESHMMQFVVHSALDMIDEAINRTISQCLNVVDEFKSAKSGPAKSVSAYVTAGNVRMLLVHEHKSGMKAFFEEVHRLYVKVLLNPFYVPGTRITSTQFATDVRDAAKRYLGFSVNNR